MCFMVQVQELHPWNVSIDEATAIQVRLAPKVARFNFLPEDPELVIGTDVSPPNAAGRARAAAVVVRLSDNTVLETTWVCGRLTFDYVPGLFSFR